MNSSKSVKKWKSFDFGPEAKKKCTNKIEVKENLECEAFAKIPKKGNTNQKGFDFHRQIEPRHISDLAVHPKKIQEVHEWITYNVVTNPQQDMNVAPFLLISGPTGSGKTTTLSVVCKTLGISIVEWINPVDQEFEYRGTSQIDNFLDFLIESKWNSLFESSTNKRITLVKDFPNAVIHRPDRFLDILESCQYKSRHPVIFICTESSSNNINLLRTLFPEEVISKFDITHINFNPCAPSLMKIAIQRAQALLRDNPKSLKQPSQKIVDAILSSTVGDIRNAMMQFHMASLSGTDELPTVFTKAQESIGSKRKRSNKDVKLKTMFRDESLGLFHGLGRVLNPKRKEVGKSWRLERDVEKLVDEFSTQPQMFHSFLFENYLKYFGNVGEASKASEILSMSARFLENWMDRNETLMFALWISVLGLMVFNEHKVSKWTQIKAPTKYTKKIVTNSNTEGMNLNPTDYYYYNLITKSNKFHEFIAK
nr:cell cycle checkpoint protein RAD17 [Leptinotarsa decemlineata]